MTLSQIKKFTRKVNNGKDIKVIKHEYGDDSFAASTWFLKNLDPIITINKNVEDKREIQRCLLHEIGHINCGVDFRKRTKAEIDAQLWAIRRAVQLRYYRLAEELCSEVYSMWMFSEWDSDQRIYRLAAKILLGDHYDPPKRKRKRCRK